MRERVGITRGKVSIEEGGRSYIFVFSSMWYERRGGGAGGFRVNPLQTPGTRQKGRKEQVLPAVNYSSNGNISSRSRSRSDGRRPVKKCITVVKVEGMISSLRRGLTLCMAVFPHIGSNQTSLYGGRAKLC